MAKRCSLASSSRHPKRRALRASSCYDSSSECSSSDSEDERGLPTPSDNPASISTKTTSSNSFRYPISSSIEDDQGSSPAIISPQPEQAPQVPAFLNRTLHESRPTPTVPNVGAPVDAASRTISESRNPSYDSTVMLPSSPNSLHRLENGTLTALTTPDRFPVFRHGNVIIETAPGTFPKEFRLHSTVLMRHSSWFAHAIKQTDTANPHPTWFLYKFQYVNGKMVLINQRATGRLPNAGNTAPRLGIADPQVKLENEDQVPVLSERSPESTPAAQTPGDQLAVTLYGQIFGMFYNLPPTISTADIGSTLVRSEELVKIASELGCIHLVRPHLGNALGQYRQALFVAVKSDPARWLQLAIALEDVSVYTEALIHLVGAHPRWPWLTKRTILHEDMRQLIRRKSQSLAELCIEVDRDLLLLTINDRRGEAMDLEDRGNFETWILVQMFRDTIARYLNDLEDDNRGVLRRGAFYRKIQKGGYMEYEATMGMGKRLIGGQWKDLGTELKDLKRCASELVERVAVNELMIDPDAHELGYLTCTKVTKEDIPWQSMA